MKYFKDVQANQVYAYESDGSQDAFIKDGLVPITAEEARQFSSEVEAKMLAEANKNNVDPVEKLKAFLAANPDVQKLLGGNNV